MITKALLLAAALLVVSNTTTLRAAAAMPELYSCRVAKLNDVMKSYKEVERVTRTFINLLTGRVLIDSDNVENSALKLQCVKKDGTVDYFIVKLPLYTEHLCEGTVEISDLSQDRLNALLEIIAREIQAQLNRPQPNLNAALLGSLQLIMIEQLKKGYSRKNPNDNALLYIVLCSHLTAEEADVVRSRAEELKAVRPPAGSPHLASAPSPAGSLPAVGSPCTTGKSSFGIVRRGAAEASKDWRTPRAQALTSTNWRA